MMNTQVQSNLTMGQFRIWAGQKLDPHRPLYNMALALRIRGKLNPDIFRAAFEKLVERSDALRTVVSEKEGIPRQRLVAGFEDLMIFEDLSTHSNPAQTARSMLKERTRKTFQMDKRLFESRLLKLAPADFIWYLNQHHLITDGWSCAIVYRRMEEFYQLASDGRLDDAPQLPPYRDYRSYEHDFRKTSQFAAAAAYWDEKQSISREAVELYGTAPSTTRTGSRRFVYDIGRQRSEALRALAMDGDFRSFSLDLSLFNIFSALLAAFLYRIGGSTRLVIGTPSHHRPTAVFKETIGLFIELFPMEITIAEKATFRSLIKSIAPVSMDFLKYALPGSGGSKSGPAYSAVLNYINASFSEFCDMPMQSEWIHPDHVDRGHALRLQVHDFDNSGSIQLHFDLGEEIFDDDLAQKAMGHFMKLVDALLQDSDQRVGAVGLLTQSEKQALADVNHTLVSRPDEPTVVALIEQQAAARPHAVAVTEQSEALSYGEIMKRSDALAGHLRRVGIGGGDRVAVYLERSADLVAALIGIMKTGAAFVPIDASFPQKRIAYVLEDCKAPVVLTQTHLAERIPAGDARIIRLDRQWREAVVGAEDTLAWMPGGDEPAYIIYTSGSTGRPKGVMIEHRALANYLQWARKQYMDDGPWDMALFSTVAADLTLTSIFLPLISGGSIRVYPEGSDGVDLSIMDVFREDAVDMIKLTPSHLSMLASQPVSANRLRKLIVGGEDFKTSLARRVLGMFDGRVEIFNEYGPTETTVGCMIHRFDPVADNGRSVAIGKPIDNMRIYLLDDGLNPVPVGVTGDIYIAGRGLARGYLNQAQLTASVFVPDPFQPGEKMYNSGDLGRWRSEGVLEFLGRKDHQVKVRGFRIELGEIESALLEVDGIRESFAQVIEHRGQAASDDVKHCLRCGLSSNHPQAKLDDDQICRVCRNYEHLKEVAHLYFKTEDDLRRIVDHARKTSRGPYDCIMQFSGGKDSTYALYQLVKMGMHPLVFSFDNGFISPGAKENIRRVVEDLNLELVWGSTPAMPKIFVDSLRRFSNVCNGCQKAVNTLSVNLAREKGIRYIFTGLSRGQFFETRVSELFANKIFDSAAIDRNIIEARKAYHRMEDAVAKHLDVSAFADDGVFEEIQFIDFYRYTDVGMDEMFEFLNQQAPWIRPTDTGRSTNCMINEAGIFVHKKERGFHNYEMPYSWDVRLGHKKRDSALEELDDDIDTARVKKILRTIGYDPEEKSFTASDRRIVAYYVSDNGHSGDDLRTALSRSLPGYMMPSHFIPMEAFPLNATGKIDRQALPRPDKGRQGLPEAFVAPRNPTEEVLAGVWARVMGIDKVGIHDNFFDLGGDSILSIQIVSQAAKYGLSFNAGQLFKFPTLADLAANMESGDAPGAEQGLVTGAVPLVPGQRWFFGLGLPKPNHWGTAMEFEVSRHIDPELLTEAFRHLMRHHDALRLRFLPAGERWEQSHVDDDSAFKLEYHDLRELSARQQETAIEGQGLLPLDVINGPLIHARFFQRREGQNSTLWVMIHHLAADERSWPILIEDLETVVGDLQARRKPILPPKTASFKYWAQQLSSSPRSAPAESAGTSWQAQQDAPAPVLARDENRPGNGREVSSDRVVSVLEDTDVMSRLDGLAPNPYPGVEALLLSALAQALCRENTHKALSLTLARHERDEAIEGTAIDRTVGMFTTLYPMVLKIPIPDAGDSKHYVGAVERQLHNIADHPPASLPEPVPGSELLFNYGGQMNGRANPQALFTWRGFPQRVRHPDGERPFLLEVHAAVTAHGLETQWIYSTRRHHRQTVERWVEAFNGAVRAFIREAEAVHDQKVEASDFPLANLDAAQLDKISKQLE